MLLVPVHNRIQWSNLPFVTLLLVVINTLIFVIFQRDDEQQVIDAIAYYHEAELYKVELPAAKSYAESSGDSALYLALNQLSDPSKKAQGKEEDKDIEMDEEAIAALVMLLQTNVKFQEALHNGKVIRITSPGYNEWRQKRDRFDDLYESVTYIHYGLRTAQPTIASVFSHMFLHADIWHLLGNMVFLFALGMLVEPVIDRGAYLISYLLAGLGSAGFDFMLRSNELIPGIGASGAIAGLMGAYAVLYGLKKIRFFYFIGVYFDYATLPAIVLLPLWIGNELVQLAINSGSGVNYLAHLGGLCSGAVLGVVVKKMIPGFNAEHVAQTEKHDKFESDMEEARKLMEDFKPEAALVVLRRLREEHPEEREVLTRSYSCSRINPSSEEYHLLAHTILGLKDSDAATEQLVRTTFNEYLRLAKPATRMNGNMICRLARRFIRQKALEESERLVRIILAKKVPCQESRRIVESFIALLQAEGRTKDAVLFSNLLPTLQQA